MTDALINCMLYHRTEALMKKAPVLEVEYACQNGACDFSAAVEQIRNDTEVSIFECVEPALEMIESIKSNQHEFLPQHNDGYQIVRNGVVVVRILRKKEEGKISHLDGRMGTIDYSDINFWDHLFTHTRSTCPIM